MATAPSKSPKPPRVARVASRFVAQTVYKDAVKVWGDGWKHLSEKQQKAAVSQEIVNLLLTSRVTPNSPLEAFQLLAVKCLQLVP